MIVALGGLEALGGGACKRTHKAAAADGGVALDGAFSRIAERLEEAFGQGPLPPMVEPEALGDRLGKWKGFRECAARTFAARRLAREKRVLPSAATPLGVAAVEECVVQAAVADRDATLCDRLAAELGPDANTGKRAAWRCHDTRARVLGLPDECPVLDLPGGRRDRNPECLAAARRDGSLCAFADDAPRCRAIVAGTPDACTPDAARNCHAAAVYWRGLIPRGDAKPLVAAPGTFTADVRQDVVGDDPPPTGALHLRFAAPPFATAISWPRGGGPVTLGWNDALSVAFDADDARAGRVPLGARFRVRIAKPAEPGVLERDLTCTADAQSRGTLVWTSAATPGGLAEGTFEAEHLACSGGLRVGVAGAFALPILDLVGR